MRKHWAVSAHADVEVPTLVSCQGYADAVYEDGVRVDFMEWSDKSSEFYSLAREASGEDSSLVSEMQWMVTGC